MDYGHQYADKKISAVDRELKKTYRTAQKQLKEKLADFENQFARKNKEKKKMLEAGEITQDEYRDWLTGQVFVRSRWQEQQRMVNAVLLDHNRQAMNIVQNSTFDVFAENYNFNAYLAEQKMIGTFNLYNAEAVARLIVDDPQLLPKWKIDQKKDYVWNQQKVNNILRQSIIQGKTIDEITQDLAEGLSTGNYNRMRLFARTAITEAENAGRQQQMNDAAEMGIEVKKMWIATHDNRTRDAHRGLDGDIVPYNEPFHSALGDIMRPGDPSAAPANVYNCRCCMQSIYPKYDKGTKRGEGVEIDGKSYEEWKEGKKKRGEVHRVDRDVYIKDISGLLEKNAFNGTITDEYKKIILESIEKTDDKMLEIVKRTINNVHVEFMEENPSHNVSHYSEGTGSITIITKDAAGELRTPEDILRTFWHEYGHYVDDAAVSGSGYGYKSEYGDYFFHSIQSEIMKDDKWMYASMEDANKLLKFAKLDDRYECKFESGYYSAAIFKNGQYVDARNPDFDTTNELEDGLSKWVKGFSKGISLDEYRKQFGYPERPDRDDYIESYYTPKRNLYRERELFKGAHDAYNNAIKKYYEDVDAFEKTHDMAKINDDWLEIAKKAEKRKEAVAPATDTFDGGVCGSFFAFILHGGHESKYYATNRMGAKEGIANVFSALMTKNKNELDAMEELCPNVFNLIKGVILK